MLANLDNALAFLDNVSLANANLADTLASSQALPTTSTSKLSMQNRLATAQETTPKTNFVPGDILLSPSFIP